MKRCFAVLTFNSSLEGVIVDLQPANQERIRKRGPTQPDPNQRMAKQQSILAAL
jgi:hypothetical protein